MNKIASFVIHVARSLIIDMVFCNDGSIVSNQRSCPLYICIAGIGAKMKICEQCFTVVGKTFMEPHVSQVIRRDIVSEPFVSAFMNYDEVPFESPT